MGSKTLENGCNVNKIVMNERKLVSTKEIKLCRYTKEPTNTVFLQRTHRIVTYNEALV